MNELRSVWYVAGRELAAEVLRFDDVAKLLLRLDCVGLMSQLVNLW